MRGARNGGPRMGAAREARERRGNGKPRRRAPYRSARERCPEARRTKRRRGARRTRPGLHQVARLFAPSHSQRVRHVPRRRLADRLPSPASRVTVRHRAPFLFTVRPIWRREFMKTLALYLGLAARNLPGALSSAIMPNYLIFARQRAFERSARPLRPNSGRLFKRCKRALPVSLPPHYGRASPLAFVNRYAPADARRYARTRVWPVILYFHETNHANRLASRDRERGANAGDGATGVARDVALLIEPTPANGGRVAAKTGPKKGHVRTGASRDFPFISGRKADSAAERGRRTSADDGKRAQEGDAEDARTRTPDTPPRTEAHTIGE